MDGSLLAFVRSAASLPDESPMDPSEIQRYADLGHGTPCFGDMRGSQLTQTEDRKTDHALPSAHSWRRVARPLEAVVGLADMLRDRSRDVSAAARNEMIDQLAINARALENALDDVVVATQLANIEVEFDADPIDLRELISAVAREWTLGRVAHVSISGVVEAIGDEQWTGYLVRNMLEDAYNRGGRNLSIRLSDGYSKAMVEIDDDGASIPVTEMEAMADAGHRGQAINWKGSTLGQGAAVARELAKAMGGDLRYFRADGVNSCELTLRKQASAASRRRQLPNVSLYSTETRPTREDIVGLLEDESIPIVYQPIVDIRAWSALAPNIVGFESLARFPHSTPPEWFELAGSAGLGVDLEILALKAGVRGFSAAGYGPFLALNLSNSTLLSSQLLAALDGIDPGRVVLELSDTARIRSYDVTRRAVEVLRERGVRLAVDDVGAGEIDLWHILRLDPEIIKLDRQLVADPQNVRRNDALIRGITTMARDLGIMVVAEALETEAERQRMLELGVDFGQGYLFGKPASLEWKARVLGEGPA
jgi:EAL domain-containing protein (putative c-di-GMP-specific phosphodiesterase class I)